MLAPHACKHGVHGLVAWLAAVPGHLKDAQVPRRPHGTNALHEVLVSECSGPAALKGLADEGRVREDVAVHRTLVEAQKHGSQLGARRGVRRYEEPHLISHISLCKEDGTGAPDTEDG